MQGKLTFSHSPESWVLVEFWSQALTPIRKRRDQNSNRLFSSHRKSNLIIKTPRKVKDLSVLYFNMSTGKVIKQVGRKLAFESWVQVRLHS